MAYFDNRTKQCVSCKVVKPITDFHRTDKYYRFTRAECKECFNATRARLRALTFDEALSFYSNGTNCCQCCGEARREFLTFDHINGRPIEEQRLSNGKRSSVVSILHDTPKSKWPTDLRVLCYNCNLARGRYGYCPHEKEQQPSTASELPRGVGKEE